MQPVFYNTLADGNRRRVYSKWHAYQYGSKWHTIEPEFRNDGSGFVSDRGPFRFYAPQFANQTAVFEVTNNYNIFTHRRIHTPPMEFELTPLGVDPTVAGRIDEHNPTQVWYDDAWGPGLSLRYTVWHGRAPRATREAVIDPTRGPRGRDLHAAWLLQSPRALTLINGQRPRNPDGSEWTGSRDDTATLPPTGASVHYFDGQLNRDRGGGFKPPKVWYYTRAGKLVTEHATVTARVVSSSQIQMTKTVPARIIDAAAAEGSLVFCDDTQTFYPDPSPETSSVDGYVRYLNTDGDSTWAQVIAGTNGTLTGFDSGSLDDVTYLRRVSGGWRQVNRAVLVFDLTSITGQTVDSGTFAMYAQDDSGTGCTVALDGSDWHDTSTTSVTDAAWSTGSGTKMSDTVYEANGTPNWDINAVQEFDLNAAGIAHVDGHLGGHTTFMLRDEDDLAGTDPKSSGTMWSYCGGAFAEWTTDPYLELTLSASGGGNRAAALAMLLQL
jgi:hypothetical protein